MNTEPTTISIKTTNHHQNLTLTNIGSDLAIGDTVYVTGVLEADNTLQVDKLFIEIEIISSDNKTTYMWLASFIGLTLTLLLFLTYWKPGYKKYVFRRRL
ncbi:hypothetical protein [Methanonatronarchaeum sp. AMET-Sl]|uniref:hypothetical protein n=1 Tax=Methanonatronarchaeum sp. AMET-Sl TaxID=3037654 RepID=UPI00244DF681|nr:hypothetical protein [Methanonatronarchaeum sp. AMET-Sl]WGI17683.1 hypothetical protein QEN48_01355 [Methanonatronarchaeum sp. AMET-Sl]